MTLVKCAGGCGREVMSAMADDAGQIDSQELYCDECYEREARLREPIRCATRCNQWPNCRHDWRHWERKLYDAVERLDRLSREHPD